MAFNGDFFRQITEIPLRQSRFFPDFPGFIESDRFLSGQNVVLEQAEIAAGCHFLSFGIHNRISHLQVFREFIDRPGSSRDIDAEPFMDELSQSRQKGSCIGRKFGLNQTAGFRKGLELFPVFLGKTLEQGIDFFLEEAGD